MSSNILAGERRWASARRTGMTVLGKVAVPKPINLPSQRLENQGLDPNVEIVPKGTLGWGSRPSSSTSNPWGSSSLSSTAEGYGSSPGHPSGRPSSSGSRPSTAGSEITHDRSSNAWGLGSRPSSASGTSASKQTSLTSLRPQSAETRPGSSLTSRFAEPCTATSACLPNVTAEGVGLASSLVKEKFSLSSGDFPTLNSTTDGSIKNSDSRDQGSHSPSSASGRVAEKYNSEMSQADVENRNIDSWKREGYRGGDDIHPTVEKWHGEPPRYHNPNVPNPQFDGWRGPSVNPPGVWYRGLPPGPPYGAPVAPGGFPLEPFPYYCPQMPPSGLANSQPVPLPGPGPRPGPMGHPKNGEPYRPPMPDAFVRPGMPFRPGFYHGPMPFEGYYGPPMGYSNPNEREVPFKGMAAGPPAYNRFPACDNDPGPFNMADGNDSTYHKRTVKNISNVKRSSEKNETSHFDDAPGRVLLKQNGGVGNQEGQFMEKMAAHSFPNSRRSQAVSASRTKGWGADNNSDDDMYLRIALHSSHSSPGPADDCGGSDSATVRFKSYESRDEVIDDQRLKNLEAAASSSPELSHVPIGADGSLTSSGIARDPTLMQKVEGLNEKVRSSDFRNEGVYPSQWEEQKGARAIIGEIMVPLEDKTSQLTAAPRRRYGVVRGEADDNSKQKFNGPSGDDGRKKLGTSVQASDLTPASSFHGNRTNMIAVAAESRPAKHEVESEVDSTDTQAQRFKMRELAKQRALQLQKEEEERTREQRAKALAKLEELNRRTPEDNNSIPKDEKALPNGISQAEQGPQALVESSRAVTKPLSQSPPLDITPGIGTQVTESSGGWGEEFADLDNHLPLQTLKTSPLDPAVLPSQSLPPKEESPLQFNEAGASRNKRSGYKQKQNVSVDTNVRNKTAVTKARQNNKELACSDIVIESPGDVGASGISKIADAPTVAVDLSSQQRRKSSKNSKNKSEPDSLPSASIPSTTPDESNRADFSVVNEISMATHSGMDKGLIPVPTNGSRAGGSSKQQSSFVAEEAQGRINMHRKSQQSRRGGRNQKTTRFTDKYHGNDNVVWAPVQLQNKAEPESESVLKAVQDTAFSPKTDDQVQNNMKSKRAEMERYVPKPVAKELAQQGAIQQSGSSSVGLSVSDTDAVKLEFEPKISGKQSDLVAGSVAPVLEFQMGDLRHNKQPKALGGWQQRGPLEQQQAEGVQNGSSAFTSKPSKAAQLSMAQNESSRPDLSKTKAEETSLRDLSASDSGDHISPQRRDQRKASRTKRHTLKGERSTGNDREDEINFGSLRTDKSHVQQQDPRINQIGKSSSSKENRGFEERASSHWQPKFGPTSNIHGRGSSSGAHTVAAEAGVTGKKGNQSLPEERISQHAKLIKETDSRLNPSAPKSNVLLEGNVGHQGQRRERKFSSSKGQPYFQNEDSVGADEYMSRESQNKQPIPSDNRRSRYHNVRPTASHDFRGDLDQERHCQNRHYEYQPIGTKDDRKFENAEDGSSNVGPRYKERGQSHSRRGSGQFHGRQSSNIQLDAGYG